MAKISALPVAPALQGTDILPVSRPAGAALTTYQVPAQSLMDQIAATAQPYVASAQAASAATQALLATAQDFSTDAYQLQQSYADLSSGGLSTLDQASAAYARSLDIKPTKGVFRSGTSSKASLANMGIVTSSRASAALALTSAGLYKSFAANILRQTDLGIIGEGAATTLAPYPTTFSAASGFTTTPGKTAVYAAGTAPAMDTAGTNTGTKLGYGTNPGYYFDRAGASNAGTYAAAGSYTTSFVVARADERYVGYTDYIGTSFAFLVDFDAAGGPAVTKLAGGFVSATVTPMAGGLYRIAVNHTVSAAGNRNAQWQRATASGLTTTVGTAGQSLITLYHEQVEAGAKATSPILTGSATRAADVATIAIPAGVGGDRISITYQGGSAGGIRSALASPNIIDLVNDLAAPWAGKFITGIQLVPAIDKTLTAPTENGFTAYHIHGWSGRWYWNGADYPDEATMVAAMGGSGSLAANSLILGDYVDPAAPNLLGTVDFTIDTQRFTNLNNATIDTTSSPGYLTLTTTSAAGNSEVTRAVRVAPGRAYRLSAIINGGTNGGASLIAGDYSSLPSITAGLARTATVSGSTDTAVSLDVSANASGLLYFGLGFGFPTSGKTMKLKGGVSLQAVTVAKGYPVGGLSKLVDVTMPAALPAATVVIKQWDAGASKDRVRLELRTDGTIHLVQQCNAGTTAAQDLTLGTVTASQRVTIALGWSTAALRGAIGGVSAELGGKSDTSEVAIMAVGVSYERSGNSLTLAEAFTGTINAEITYNGLESPAWMRHVTASIDPTKGWGEGDSYMEGGVGATGISPVIAGKYDLIATAVGGSTWEAQLNRILNAQNLADFGKRTLVWWDGDPNGRAAATFTGSISGTTLTTDGNAAIRVGMRLYKNGVALNTRITAQVDATHWTVDTPQNVISGTIGGTAEGYAAFAFQGYVAAGVLQIPGSTNAPLVLGSPVSIGGTTYAVVGFSGSGFTLDQNVTIGSSSAPVAVTWASAAPNFGVEMAQLQQVIAALGHTRWMVCQSGRISPARGVAPVATIVTSTSVDTLDMLAFNAAISAKYGGAHSWDAWPILKLLAIGDPAASGYAQDQSDVQNGYFPRSIMIASDTTHLIPWAKNIAFSRMAAIDAGLVLPAGVQTLDEAYQAVCKL